MKTELKPCPLCGGAAVISQTGKNELHLKCILCLIGLKQKVLRLSLEWLEDKMITDWNKRITATPIAPKRLSSLHEDLHTCKRIAEMICVGEPISVWGGLDYTSVRLADGRDLVLNNHGDIFFDVEKFIPTDENENSVMPRKFPQLFSLVSLLIERGYSVTK